MRRTWCFFVVLAFCGAAVAQTAKDDKLADYLTDVTAGTVSAANLAGVDKSLIVEPQTSQDLVLALKPFTSGDSKTGFGLAITPARTAITPMSGRTYLGDPRSPSGFNFARLAGNLTASYAQAGADLSGLSVTKTAASLDTHYFFNVNDDPIKIGADAFEECRPAFVKETGQLAVDLASGKITQAQFDAAMAALVANQDAACKKTIDARLKLAPWNAARIALSWGKGWVRSDTAGFGSHSLGNAWTINAVAPIGKEAAIYGSVRRVRDALDLQSIGGTLKSTSTTLAAVRLTYGSQNDSSLRFLAEASNAKKNVGTEFNNVYLRAIGIDKKISKGMWLEFRLGRNRTMSSTDGEQTTGLLNLKLAPSEFLFAPAK